MADMTRIEHDGHILEIEHTYIEVTSSLGHEEPDPNWSFTDDRGHVHRDASTLTRVDRHWTDPDGDEGDDTVWYCTACRQADDLPVPQEIRPATIYVPPSPLREYIPGPSRYLLDGRSVSRAEASRVLLDHWDATLQKQEAATLRAKSGDAPRAGDPDDRADRAKPQETDQ